MARTAHTARKVPGRGQAAAAPSESGKRPRSLSVRTPTISQSDRPKPSKRASSTKLVLKEIKFYQTTVGFLIPKAGLVRLVRSILAENIRNAPTDGLRFTSPALNILHESIENHLVNLMEFAYMAARHAKRVTLFPSDLRLIARIKGTGK